MNVSTKIYQTYTVTSTNTFPENQTQSNFMQYWMTQVKQHPGVQSKG